MKPNRVFDVCNLYTNETKRVVAKSPGHAMKLARKGGSWPHRGSDRDTGGFIGYGIDCVKAKQ